MLSLAALATAVVTALSPIVITGDDAVRPRAGEDYTRIAALHLPQHSAVEHVTEDGQLVLVREHRPRLLIDAASGRRTPLPSPGHVARVVDLTDAAVWYADDAAVYRYDRAAERMRRYPLPDVGRDGPARVLGSYGARWYFSYGRHTEEVWSVEIASPASAQRELRRKVAPSLIGGLLTWTEGDRVALRELATDEVERWAIPDDCTADSRLQGTGSEFVLNVHCDRPESKTLVYDATGTVTTVLRVDIDEGAFGTRDRGAFFADAFYDFTTGRLLDLRTPMSSLRAPIGSDGEQPVQVWPMRDRDLVVRLK